MEEKEIKKLAEKIRNNQATPEEELVFLEQANIAVEGLIDFIRRIEAAKMNDAAKDIEK